MIEDENEQSQEPVESTETEQSNEPATIADVAEKFNVEQQATEFQTQTAPEPTETIPDTTYYDQETQHLVSELKSLRDDVSGMKQQASEDRLNQDIKLAVGNITELVEVDPLIAEIYMEKKYRDEPNYKKIWDNRYANPGAVKAAAKILANEIAEKFKIKSDPQLLENVRSAKKSQLTSATAPPDKTLTDQMMDLSDGDFDKKWAEMKG